MGRNWHIVVSLLVASFCHAASDVNIVGSITVPVQSSTLNGLVEDVNDSVVLYGSDIHHSLEMIRTYGIPAGYTVQDIEDNTRNILTKLGYIESSLDEFLSLFKIDLTFYDSYSQSKSLHVSDAGTHEKLDNLIDTNQYYLSEILAELRKRSRDTNYLDIASLWAMGALNRNMNQDALGRYNTSLEDLLDHIDDPDYLFKYFGIWQYGPMEILFNYDWYSLDGAKRTPTAYDPGSEADVYYKFAQQFLGFPTKAKEYAWLANNTSPMGKLKMKYYGTYPIYLAVSNLVSHATNTPPDILSSSWFTKDGGSYIFSTNNALVDSIQPTIDAVVETNNLNALEAPDDVWNGFDDDDKPGSKDKFMVSFGINKRFNYLPDLTNTIIEGVEMKKFNEDTESTMSRLFDSFQDEFSSLNDDNGSFEIVYHQLSVPGLHTPVAGTKSIKIYSSDVNDNPFVAILQMIIDVNELCIGFFGSILLVRRVLKRMP